MKIRSKIKQQVRWFGYLGAGSIPLGWWVVEGRGNLRRKFCSLWTDLR